MRQKSCWCAGFLLDLNDSVADVVQNNDVLIALDSSAFIAENAPAVHAKGSVKWLTVLRPDFVDDSDKFAQVGFSE